LTSSRSTICYERTLFVHVECPILLANPIQCSPSISNCLVVGAPYAGSIQSLTETKKKKESKGKPVILRYMTK